MCIRYGGIAGIQCICGGYPSKNGRAYHFQNICCKIFIQLVTLWEFNSFLWKPWPSYFADFVLFKITTAGYPNFHGLLAKSPPKGTMVVRLIMEIAWNSHVFDGYNPMFDSKVPVPFVMLKSPLLVAKPHFCSVWWPLCVPGLDPRDFAERRALRAMNKNCLVGWGIRYHYATLFMGSVSSGCWGLS